MQTWWESVQKALENLGGQSKLKQLYEEVENIRTSKKLSVPISLEAVVRKELEYNSSNSTNWRGVRDIFYSVEGIGNGVWGLKSKLQLTPCASDIEEPGPDVKAPRLEVKTFRILRDTSLSRKIKLLHKNKCQLCGSTIILADGITYSEAHHLMPLGVPHNGPDIAANIIIVCPNDHVLLDYGAIPLNPIDLNEARGHRAGKKFIDYHNSRVLK